MCINRLICQVDIYFSQFCVAYAQALLELEDSNSPYSAERS
jgi:hypothetical protein